MFPVDSIVHVKTKGIYRKRSVYQFQHQLREHDNLESKRELNLKLLARKSMKQLQVFNIYIWKKFFQINHASNDSGGTSFLQFHTNQTTDRIKLVHFLNCPQFFASIPNASVIRTYTFINRYFSILRKVQLCRVKGFKVFFQPKDLKAIFPVNKLNDSSFLFFQAITDLNIPFINFNTNLFKDTTPRFLKDTITN